MEKKVLAGASREKQKYFFEPAFNEIPQAVKDEIRNICILMADFDFDDIGAELEIKSLKSEKKELIKALNLWYVINMTDEGVKIREELLREKNN